MGKAIRRVLFFPFLYFAEEWNGIDEHLHALARHMDTGEFDFSVLVHESDGPQTAELARRAKIRPIGAPYRGGAGAREKFHSLRRLLRSEEFDVVHFHTPVAGGQVIPVMAARVAGVRRQLITYHQIQPWPLPTKSRALAKIIHRWPVYRTVAVSSDVRRSLSVQADIRPQDITVIPNGIDDIEGSGGSCDLPPAGDGEVRVGYFGRLSPEKDVTTLIRAFAISADRSANSHLYVVGDGPERCSLVQEARALGIESRVTFLGFRRDARDLMHQMDVIVHLPQIEGFGLVVLEAMAAGRPVVATDAPGGLRELIAPDETGLLVPVGQPAVAAEAVLRLVEQPHERTRMGRNARARFEAIGSAPLMAERVAELYRK